MIEITRKGFRTIARRMRETERHRASEVKAVRSDVREIKENVEKLFELMNGQGESKGVLTRLVVLEDRVSNQGRWVFGAIVGLISILLTIIGSLVSTFVLNGPAGK